MKESLSYLRLKRMIDCKIISQKGGAMRNISMWSWICFVGFLGAIQMACVPVPTKPTDYVTVPFSKLVSGAFVDEYSGKPIRLQGSFWAQGPQFLPGGISQGRYIGFGMAGPGGYGADGSGLWVDVVVPKEQSALVFELNPGEGITILGVAQRAIRGGRATLYIMAYELRKAR
jgi:hypothetical protein